MLQPLQLKEVSTRYAGEIAELRDFLAKAGVPVGTSEALTLIAERVRDDRGFHRDLISYVWVVIDGSGRQIGYSDLLGVLAIAAAGERFAAVADEGAAHDVLRFLMEARHELDETAGNPARTQSAGRRFLGPEGVAPDVPATPVPVVMTSLEPPVVQDEEQEILLRPAQSEQVSSAEMREESDGGHRRLVWVIVIVACVLAALLIGWWMYLRPADNNMQSPASTITEGDSASPSAGVEREAPGVRNNDVDTAVMEPGQARTQSPAARREMRAAPSASSHASARTPFAVQESVASTPARSAGISPSSPPAVAYQPPSGQTASVASAPAPVVRSAAPSSGAVPVRVAPRTTANTAPVAVPADVLSKRVGARSMPEDLTPYGIEASGRKHPVLKRREPHDGILVAEANIPARPGSGSTSAGTARGGIVRTGTEGIMSASLLYSPAPVYPSAASAARVEGEVRVQASIDRDGNVAAARVISGPPLLRDAALNAVHHWRFRPRVSHGKPAPSSATAVFDFELP